MIEEFPVEPGQQHVPVPELPLVRDIVNREERVYVPVAGLSLIELAQINRRQPGLPIVKVQQARPEIEQANSFQHRPAEENETLAVIRVIPLLAPRRGYLIHAA